ncbi:MAG: cytochrome c biogenesis protein CcsA [Pseudomonadota bacterium]
MSLPRWILLLGGLALLALLAGHGVGLFATPPEASMGETGRILYLHVPTAWAAMLTLTAAFACAIGALWSGKAGWDAGMEAGIEVGLLFAVLICVQGPIWAYPTQNYWWTWDPRLTTTAIMVVAFVGVLVMRALIHQHERRMAATAVATIVSWVDVPIVYFSVKWWDSVHQDLSEVGGVDRVMLLPLLVSLAGTTLLAAALFLGRFRIARRRYQREEVAPELPDLPAPLDLEGSP